MSEAVTILLRPGRRDKDTFTLVLESDYVGKRRFKGTGYSELAKVGGAVRASLEATGHGRHPLSKDPDHARNFLEDIRENGSVALGAMVRHPLRREELKEFLRKVLEAAPTTPRPVLKFDSPVDLPLDLMPALEPEKGLDFTAGDADGLADQAQECFLGLRFSVRKVMDAADTAGDDSAANLVLRAESFSEGPRVPLAPYWHRGLDRVGDEIEDLHKLEFCDVEKPLPDDALLRGKTAERDLARMLVHGRQTRGGIVHVTSHCDASERTPSLDHSLVLGGRLGLWKIPVRVRGRTLKVRVRSIDYQWARLARERKELPGPLGFISACGATDVRFDSPTSIPKALLDAGYRTVVSPLVSVHVDPAFAMAFFFYGELKKGSTVGAALVQARIDLMRSREGHTPLGLLYTCYGESALRLDDEVVAAPLRNERVPA